MKHFFKYGAGYINVDGESLYLTKNGNWEEAGKLAERKSKMARINNKRITWIRIFFSAVYGIIVLALLQMVDSNLISITAIILLGILTYYLLEYFRSALRLRYRIPLSKISSIEKHNNRLKITFMNSDGETDRDILDNVETAGITMLTDLKKLRL